MAKKPKQRSASPGRKVVIREQTPYTLKLRLNGPASLNESTVLAATLNGVIAKFNTLYFKNPDGTMRTPRIKAVTGSVE
jgi:hypothetical protein